MTYSSYAELAAAETLNVDYEIRMGWSDPRWFGTNSATGRWGSRNAGFYRFTAAMRAGLNLDQYQAGT